MSELQTPFEPSQELKKAFDRQGYVRIKNFLSPETLAEYEPEFSRLVEEHRQNHWPKPEDLDFYTKQFVQLNSTWRLSEKAREFVFSPRLASLAAGLMGVEAVRLYHDQALYKEKGGGPTLYHQDGAYWPLDTENACALWIPLQATPLDMGPLAFVQGSHRFPYKSEHAITPEGEEAMLAYLREKGCEAVHEPFELGEVSIHNFWTCHTAKPNQTGQTRKVITINYFEDGTKLARPQPSQEGDRNGILNDSQEGQPIRGERQPLLWDRKAVNT